MVENYSPGDALKYAKEHWFCACDDDIFWTTKGTVDLKKKRIELKALPADKWKFLFVLDSGEKAIFRDISSTVPEPDKIVEDDADLFQDCTHFISRCLRAGGLQGETPRANEMITNLEHRDLMEALKKEQRVKVLAEEISRDQAQKIMDANLLSAGDVIGYVETDKSGKLKSVYGHSALYLGEINDDYRIACHSTCRYGGESYPYARGAESGSSQYDVWHLDRKGWRYTLIHFPTQAELTLSSALRNSLAGWWQINGNPTIYQYVERSGKSYLTSHRPRNDHQGTGAAPHGYWFDKRGIKFVWRDTGRVDTWTAIDSDNVKVSIDGGIAVTGFRLF